MPFLSRCIAPAVLLWAAGCASTSFTNSKIPEARPAVVAQRVAAAGWPKDETHRASSLYALKCGGCHKFFDPKAYDADDWEMWMDKMARKSKLTAPQTDLLTRYLESARQ